MNAPTATKASSQRSTGDRAGDADRDRGAIETAASAEQHAAGICVDRGRPLSSSSACAPIPTARKKAASAAPSRPGYQVGASAAPITT